MLGRCGWLVKIASSDSVSVRSRLKKPMGVGNSPCKFIIVIEILVIDTSIYASTVSLKFICSELKVIYFTKKAHDVRLSCPHVAPPTLLETIPLIQCKLLTTLSVPKVQQIGILLTGGALPLKLPL